MSAITFPRSHVREQVTQALLGKRFLAIHNETGTEVEVECQQIAWHSSKAIVIGRVTTAGAAYLVGTSYLGTTATALAKLPELFDGIGGSETELAYLDVPLDLENGKTSHEMGYRLAIQYAAELA